ncbi:MAG: MFS transporter [Actinobacteria bacterium]|nr:MAG: MFS transporter [Actinomycetota bacterium]TMK18881.1 MAG: MFS transporter [Actinomycetota bacterium]TMK91370.1 MAG: MFS transporter [Actinomycetota bacterium]TMM24529.1 MAG: MFS transporter [Actinomycetota bacterium]
MAGRLRRIAIDVTPLRVSRDFRLLWSGSFVSAMGSQFARVGLYVQVFVLTGSPAQVGLLGVSGLIGSFAGVFIGGSFIDAQDRRTVLIWTQVAHLVVSGVLVAGALGGHPPLLLLHGANCLTWLLGSIDSPARQAATPRLVGTALVPQATALNQVLFQTTGIVGPALAGLLIAATSPTAAYTVDLVSYAGLLLAALAMAPVPPEPSVSGVRPTGLPAVREGFTYVRRDRLIQSTFVIDLIAMIFGMPQALFPILAVEQFHRGAAVVGLLFAAPAVGALVQALAAGPVTRIVHQGEAVLWAVIGWGGTIAAFGLVGQHLGWALLFLAIAGAADVISAIFRSTILQVTVPDALRGRLSGIFILVVTGGPKLGDLEAGLVAAAVSPTFSVISGGLACVVGAFACAAAYPELRRYEAPRTAVP